jgi:hypothetical protein
VKTNLLISLVVALSILAPTESLPATRVFADDFESGALGKWEHLGTFPMAQITTASKHGGTHAVMTNWDGTQQWQWEISLRTNVSTWRYTNEFFIRFWWRIDPNCDPKNGPKFMRLLSDGSEEMYIAHDLSAGGTLFQHWQFPTDQVNYSSLSISDHNWHKIEIYVKYNNPNSSAKFWVDGVLESGKYPFTGNFGSNKLNHWDWPSNWSNNPGWEHDATNYLYMDDVEIFSDSTTGEACTGRMDDASIAASAGGSGGAPAAPTGLRVDAIGP